MNRPRKYGFDDYPLYRRACNVFRAIQQRSGKKGLPFDLTPEWILQKYQFGKCELTGLSFEFHKKKGILSPSVDRIIPSKGYVKDNCRVIIWWINLAKQNMEDYQLWHLCDLAVNSLDALPAPNVKEREEIIPKIT